MTCNFDMIGSVTVRVTGKLRASPTSVTTQISGNGGFVGNFTITASPAVTADTSLTIVPPSSYSVSGGNTVTIPSGQSSVVVSLIGGTSPSAALPLSFGYSSSSDPYFSNILATPPVSAKVVGISKCIHTSSLRYLSSYMM
jgi:hypothetical protein